MGNKKAIITERSSGKSLFESGLDAETLRRVRSWIEKHQLSGGLPDDDRLTMFVRRLHRASVRIDAHARKMADFTDALDVEEDP